MARARKPVFRRAGPVTTALKLPSAHAHLFGVTLTVVPTAAVQRLTLPVWIPGSYLVREFSKNLQQACRRARAVADRGRCSSCDKMQLVGRLPIPRSPLQLQYEVYALDNSVRTAWLDAERGFFNGTSLCLRVEGQDDAPHRAGAGGTRRACPAGKSPPGWHPKKSTRSAASAATPRPATTRWRTARWRWAGSGAVPSVQPACRTALVVAVPPPVRSMVARLLADTRRICEAAIRFWHGAKKPPACKQQAAALRVHAECGGRRLRRAGAPQLHRADRVRKDLPRLGRCATSGREGYTTLLGLISHEYFHTWNVKRLRPAEFARYDYGRENYTSTCCGSSRASPATTTTCCCAAPGCWTTPAT
jgi:predicted metalloprotease with PDZ domain